MAPIHTHSFKINRPLAPIALALALAFPMQAALAQVSYFTVDNTNATTGTMSLSATRLGNVQLTTPTTLTTGSNVFNYAAVFFTPTNSASYTFGQTAAPVDTVMILYNGIFSATSPGTGALVGNDDTSQGAHRTSTGNAGLNVLCGGSALCPQITSAVVAGQRYTILISTFNPLSALGLPLTFYSTGLGTFAATAPAVVAVAGVYNSAVALTNSPGYSAAQVIDANTGLANLFSGLTGNQAISNGLNQTLPLLTGGSMIAATAASTGINRVVQARVEANRGLSSGDDFAGDKNVWMKPFGSWAEQGDVGAVTGYKAGSYGFALGVDYTASTQLRTGVALATATSTVDANSSNAPQRNTVNVYQLIGYGSYSLDANTDVNFQVDVGQNNNKGSRTIALTSTVASASYDSTSAHIGAGIGRSYPVSEKTTLTPSVRADYTWIEDGAYTETGAGLLNLTVDKRSSDMFVLATDAKLTHALSSATTLILSGSVGYDTVNKAASITAAFAGAPGASFVTQGLKQDPWIGSLGLGVTHKTQKGVALTARYDAESRTSFLNQTLSAKLRWAF